MQKNKKTSKTVLNSAVRKAIKEEIKPIKENLVTKNDVRNILWETEQRFEEKLEENYRKYRDDVLRGLDKVMKELEINREERIIEQGHYEKLGKRVNKLETAVFQ